ncbi:hypothetical protein IV102_29245 [bacterium]|nr:hypothetical protein [bacterium]
MTCTNSACHSSSSTSRLSAVAWPAIRPSIQARSFCTRSRPVTALLLRIWSPSTTKSNSDS